MENSKGPSAMRNVMYNGRHSLLPPKSPFPTIGPSYVDYVASSAVGQKVTKNKEGNSHHQRTSSESILIEEQPSWLDELLDEPETPVRRGHRRSSSDSFAYTDAANAAIFDYAALEEYKFKNLVSVPLWGPQELDPFKGARHAPFIVEPNPMLRHKNQSWEASQNTLPHSSSVASARDKVVLQCTISSSTSQEADGVPSKGAVKQDFVESSISETNASSERKDAHIAKTSSSDTDTKRAKQQFAQRSRVRKLQYIAELERNVQALQAEGTEVSAELEFLNQQSLILSMENKSLKQRLANLSQEQLIKRFEHDVLEREIGRLRALYQQQQLPPAQPSPGHRRTNSRDKLESQLANLSLKNKDSGSTRDSLPNSLHT